MRTIGTDGRIYILNPNKNARDIQDGSQSSLHLKARGIISSCLPNAIIYEEVSLTGCRGNKNATLVADFFIPNMGIIIEVHGKQHYEFTSHFHSCIANFELSLKNDSIKREWAELNGLVFIELPYNKVKSWKKIIADAIEV